MHETHVIKHILEIIRKAQEEHNDRPVRCFHFEMSELGTWQESRLREMLAQALEGTRWQNADIEVHKVLGGADLKLVHVTFGEPGKISILKRIHG